MAVFPSRGQSAPAFWDQQLRDYIDEGDSIIAPDPAPTEGQMLVWSSALGKWVPANAPGGSLLAEATNSTGVATAAVVGSVVAIPGTTFSVPPTTTRTILEFSIAAQVTTAGAGTALLGVYGGPPVSNYVTSKPFQMGNLPAGVPHTLYGSVTIAPQAVPVSYQLVLNLVPAGGSSLAYSALNGSVSANYTSSIRAIRG